MRVPSLIIAQASEDKKARQNIFFSLAGKWVSSETALEVADAALKGEGNEKKQELMWKLLKALIDAGKIPMRDRVTLIDELAEKGRLDLVHRVLAGPADVPERIVVRGLRKALSLEKMTAKVCLYSHPFVSASPPYIFT